jgi:hypothetical protein
VHQVGVGEADYPSAGPGSRRQTARSRPRVGAAAGREKTGCVRAAREADAPRSAACRRRVSDQPGIIVRMRVVLEWIHADLIRWIGTNLVALLAFFLAAWTARRQLLAGREAHVVVWFGKTPEGSGMADRLVIVNTGAGEAREVSVSFTTLNGGPWGGLRIAGEDPLPLPLLSSGDQVHMPIHVILGNGEYVRATVTWRDKRRGVQARKTTLGVTGIPLGDASGRVAVERTLDDLARQLRYR